jgi:hypothetical protein
VLERAAVLRSGQERRNSPGRVARGETNAEENQVSADIAFWFGFSIGMIFMAAGLLLLGRWLNEKRGRRF